MVAGRMGLEAILTVRVPITIGTMLISDGDCEGEEHGVGACKQTLTLHVNRALKFNVFGTF